MSKRKSVSFVLPMYNESDNIERSLNVLLSLALSVADDYEIVVVDDASRDASAGIVQGMADRNEKIKLYRMSKNTKFGGAFAEGFRRASKEIVVYMDSDMPVGEEDITRTIELIDDADIVTAVSKVEKGDTAFRRLISSGYNGIVRFLFGLNIRDINSGYKVVRRSIVHDARFISESPFVDAELFLHALRKNARIKQYSLVFRKRVGGKSYISNVPMILATFRDMIKVWFRHRKSR
jgi:glycosyltransferase involved in cell wall biosynthesis